MWSLTLPQVAATLAAALVAFDTVNASGQRLIDSRMLNAILVLMLITSILDPVLTERFTPRMLEDTTPGSKSNGPDSLVRIRPIDSFSLTGRGPDA
jgi:hypothetical protein